MSQNDNNKALLALKDLQDTQMTDEQRKEKLNRLRNVEVSEPEADLSEAEQKANQIVERMMGFNLKDAEIQEGVVLAIKRENEGVMEKAQEFTSEKLNSRIGTLKGSEEGNVVFDNMMALNDTLKSVHPSNIEKFESFVTKLLPWTSGVKRYFDQFQSTQTVITGMRQKLLDGIAEQEQDIKILKVDKNGLARMSKEIKGAIAFNQAMLTRVQQEKDNAEDMDVVEFLESQVEFNITREIQGLQELLTVNMQGQQSFEMLIRSGGDLIDSAKRCINISVNALTIAAVIAQVVAGQKKMLEGIKAVNETAEFMIGHNAKMTASTVAEIGRMAVETSLDVATLTNAIEMSCKAIQDDIDFRRSALPSMQENIGKLSEANQKAEASTAKLTKGREAKENLSSEASQLFNI